jgi:hypothetical protein
MPKRVALKDHLLVDAVDLSNFARSVRSASEHERIDVSGFSASGANEYLPGPTEQSLTVEFFGAYGAAEVHATLEPIHTGRTIVPIEWRPDQTQPVSATNPQLTGNVSLYSYGPGATRGDVDTFEAVFQAADSAGLAWSILP